jgi:hypothetical protein
MRKLRRNDTVTYNEADLFLGTKDRRTWQQARATVLWRDRYDGVDCINLQLYATVVVRLLCDDRYVIHTDGFRTVTTRARIHAWSPVRVYTVKGEWLVGLKDRNIHKVFRLVDGMQFDVNGRLLEWGNYPIHRSEYPSLISQEDLKQWVQV